MMKRGVKMYTYEVICEDAYGSIIDSKWVNKRDAMDRVEQLERLQAEGDGLVYIVEKKVDN